MEAKELMIGDWVNIKGCEIAQIRDLKDLLNVELGIFVASGVHLTEEILKANGFQYGSHAYTYYPDEDSVEAPFHILQSNRYGLRIDIPYRVVTLLYVHQLQHALRLCGLAELADNFKIE